MLLALTKKQADMLYRLVDSYVDAAGETQENRNDLAMAKRVRASPQELFAKLSDEEKIAIDLLLQDAVREDDPLSDLVADEKRRGYLKTLAAQLRALGFSIGESVALDQERGAWAEARRRYAEQYAARAKALTEERERGLRRMLALPPEVRKAVSRHRRRHPR
jgi:hypothetical protein